MSDTEKSQASAAPVDAEKLLNQARMALKTGISAYENENYAFAETLFVKALDLFEQANRLEEKEYFQCLHQVADTYFQLGRYFEAKSYYERLSVARLKNPDSTDAQVVVALLKLASTYEKLGESAEALTAFDLIMELAEKTIPNGHALFGVIFDSYEDVIDRNIIDDAEREERLALILAKREQFGFPKVEGGDRFSSSTVESTSSGEGERDNVLAQQPDELRKNLKAWTSTDILKPAALERAVKNTNQELLANLQERGDNPADVERHVQAHLHPDMFRRRPQSDQENPGVELVEAAGADSGHGEGADLAESESGADASHQAAFKKGVVERGALKGAKRPDTDRRRFNPIPALTVSACLLLVGGAIFVTHEFVKISSASSTKLAVGSLDYTGKLWKAADERKSLRCISQTTCEYTVGGAATPGNYTIKGQAGAEKSILSDLFSGKSTKMTFDEIAAGIKGSDGTVLYSDESKDGLILTKAHAIANFANYYYPQHSHLYPSKPEDFTFNNSFAWENPITGQTNKPVVKLKTHTKVDFESIFLSAVKDMRDCKPLFDADTATTPPAGLIECLALMPAGATAGGAGGGAPGASDDTACVFMVRAYDNDGKLICASETGKAFVIVLKNGISTDPVKVVHEEELMAKPLAGQVDVLINPLPAAPPAK